MTAVNENPPGLAPEYDTSVRNHVTSDRMKLEGRSAVVTGGAGGLGAATVRHLVDIGMGVAIFDRDGDRAEVLAKELGDAAAAVGG